MGALLQCIKNKRRLNVATGKPTKSIRKRKREPIGGKRLYRAMG